MLFYIGIIGKAIFEQRPEKKNRESEPCGYYREDHSKQKEWQVQNSCRLNRVSEWGEGEEDGVRERAWAKSCRFLYAGVRMLAFSLSEIEKHWRDLCGRII